MARPTCEGCRSIDAAGIARDGCTHAKTLRAHGPAPESRSAASASAPKKMPWFWCSVHAARKPATGNQSNSGCRLPGRRATLAAVAPGFAVRSTPTDGIAGAASRCSTVLENYSHVGAVTAWLMQASRRRRCTAVLIGRERSGCGSGAVPTCYSSFRKGRTECTSERMCGFERATLLYPNKVISQLSGGGVMAAHPGYAGCCDRAARSSCSRWRSWHSDRQRPGRSRWENQSWQCRNHSGQSCPSRRAVTGGDGRKNRPRS
jgi:hypothetical protein